jgi:hypothetical protein
MKRKIETRKLYQNSKICFFISSGIWWPGSETPHSVPFHYASSQSQYHKPLTPGRQQVSVTSTQEWETWRNIYRRENRNNPRRGTAISKTFAERHNNLLCCSTRHAAYNLQHISWIKRQRTGTVFACRII